MSNTRDNIPEMDYYELRRQREEYKQRMRMEQNAQNRSPAAESGPQNVQAPVSAQPQPEFIEEEAAAAPAARDAFEAAIEEGYENYDEDMEDADAPDGDANPNPFDSFIHFFHGVKSSISSRRGRNGETDDWDDDDSEFSDESGEDGQAPHRPMRVQPRADQFADAEDLHAIDVEAGAQAHSRLEAAFEGDEPAFIDDGDEDEYDDAPYRQSGFKKFMGLFVERVDETDALDEEYEDLEGDEFEADSEFEDGLNLEADEDPDEEADEAPRRRGFFSRLGRKNRTDEADEAEDEDFFPIRHDEPVSRLEGGYTMEENRTPVSAPQQAAPAAEGIGMTRRERRELAMRLAAEEAARKAQEEAERKAQEAKLAAEEKSIAIEPLFSNDEAEEKVNMAAFENAPETDILVETTAEEVPAADEPTRKFTPVNMRDLQDSKNDSIFAVDDEDEEVEDDEDFEDEIIEKKPRFSLFGRKKSRLDEDDEDFDDEDEEDEYDEDEDDEDEYDDDDEEDEIVEEKPRRGLFGRKKAAIDDDDDDADEDDEYDEDSDSDDEYDSYDEYDDDEEDDEDYDEDEYDEDDEPRRSFGHHLLRIFNYILGVIVALAVALVVCNFLYMIGHTTLVDYAHNSMGDSSAFNTLFPCYRVRANLSVDEEAADVLEEYAEITAEPTALPTPEATVSIPNLDDTDTQSTSDIVSAPVVEAAPVVEEAEVDAAPVVEGAIG